ncbi:MAG: hypothetical protein FD129_555 [bacterium]|nr:MAG: hypothetical protein FD129_555 [bacterium]
MRSRARFLSWATILALVCGCSSREHTNPFDPSNPLTGGEPSLISAAAGDGVVDLTWTIPGVDDIEAVRLRRSAAGDTGIVLPVDIDGAGAWRDTTVINDRDYSYVLEFDFAGESVSRRSDEAEATPGRLVIWVLDQSNNGPLRIAPDGRAVAHRPGRGRPSDMSLNPATGGLITVDFFNRRIERFDRTGRRGPFQEIPGSPLSVAIAEPSDSAWVGSANPSILYSWTPDLSVSTEADTGIGDPEDLAWDPARGALWMVDSKRGRLIHRRASGGTTSIDGFSLPVSVAIDPGTGDAFLADRGRRTLFRIDAGADTILWLRAGFGGLYQALADPVRGGVWVTDNLAGTITRLGGDGSIVRVIADWEAPTGLALDPRNGDLWMTDAGVGQLVRLTETGQVLQRLHGLSGPFAVALTIPAENLDPGRVAR